MNSISISKREAEVIDAIESRNLVVFEPKDVTRFLDVSTRNAYRILRRMTEKGLVQRLRRGTYIVTESYERLDSYAIASHLFTSGYIGFWTAMHFHNLTEQVPRKIFVGVTKQKRSLTVQGQTIQFVRINEKTFFGYDQYGEAVVSDPEKTVLDCLRLQEYSGGIQQIFDAITDDLDVDRIIRYAERLDNGAVASRLGYLLEQKGLLSDRERLQALVSSYTKLDQSGGRSDPVADWKLYANVSLDD